MPFIGQAVAAVLQHLDETANKYIEITSFTPTQNEVLRILEEETGAQWTVNHIDATELQKKGEEKLARGDFSAFVELLRVYLFKDGIGNAPGPDESANALLGLPAEDVRATIKTWLNEAGSA